MQNKPNSLRPKTPAKSYASKVYDDKPPRPTQKNKPNQTQSPLCEHQDKLRRSRDRSKVPAYAGDAHRDPILAHGAKLADLSRGDAPVLQVRRVESPPEAERSGPSPFARCKGRVLRYDLSIIRKGQEFMMDTIPNRNRI